MSTFVATPSALAPKSSEVSFVCWGSQAWADASDTLSAGAKAQRKPVLECPGAHGWTAQALQGLKLSPPELILVSVALALDLYGVLGPFRFWSQGASVVHAPMVLMGALLFTSGDFPLRQASPRT